MTTKPFLRRLFACSLLFSASSTLDALTFNEPGFTVNTVINFEAEATNFEFAPSSDHIIVAEQAGIIRVYDNLNDNSPAEVADLRSAVANYVDHGLLGMAIHPEFPAKPYLYVLYTLESDVPDPQLQERPRSARLSKLILNPTTFAMIEEDILITDWCQSSTSHGVGDIKFGSDGAMYVTAGDGAFPGGVDTGGDHCGDPFNEGGAMRSQDYRTNGDPLGFNGTVIRIDPETGAAMPDNPNFGGDANYARVIAYGLRNPFRFTINPINGQIFLSDVGWNATEEINYIPNATDNVIENFGWPCYEGNNRQGGYDNANVPLCESLYQNGGDTKGFYTYDHNGAQACPSGIDFYLGGNYPAQYRNALFFADYAQNWIKVANADANGNINVNTLRTFAEGDAIVDMQRGPGGDLFYLEFQLTDVWQNGQLVKPRRFRLRRISAANGGAPVAKIETNANQGPLGLNINFNGGNSTHPTGGALAYEWDLDGDGEFDDGNTATSTYTYNTEGVYPVSLRITDGGGNRDVANTMIFVSNDFPDITINSPSSDVNWATGDTINLSGSAVIPSTQAPASEYQWKVIINHCAKNDPTDCHTHTDATIDGAEGQITAPDHEYPSHLEFTLSASGDIGGVNWFDNAWQKRRALSINNDNNPARNNQTLYVALDNSRIDYNSAGTNGRSLRFVDSEGNVLRHDVASWNPNGQSKVWVELNYVPADSTNTYIWMYYDNSAANSTSTALPHSDENDLLNVSQEFAQSVFTSTATVVVQPQLATLTLDSLPSGLTLGLGSEAQPTPLSALVIVGSSSSISAASPQFLDNFQYEFDSWAHGGASSQTYVAMGDTTLIANYAETGIFNCNVDQVYFRGTANAWQASAMTVIDADDNGCIWGINSSFDGVPTDRFKFDINGDWSENYGDNNADGIAELFGEDIYINEGAGNYRITFHSVTHAYSLTKQPIGPQAPVAIAGDDVVVKMHTDVTFDGSASSDSDGNIVSYEWTSPAWQGALEGPTPMFHFHDTTGEFPVTLTVTDNQGLGASDTLTVTVNAPQAPVAVIAGGDITVALGESVTFTSAGSNDPDGEIVSYAWNNGDTTATSNQTFNTLGEQTVTLTIVDEDSLSAYAAITVTVIEEPLQQLYAQVYLRGSFNNFSLDTPMTLIADNLWHAQGNFAGTATDRFKFDINGDWTLNFGNSNGDNVADQGGGDIFITEGAGNYDIHFNDLTKVFSVEKNIGPGAPEVDAGEDINLRPGQDATFNGNAQGDAAIVSYQWTSPAWTGTLTTASPSFTFAEMGTFVVTLTVTDANGASASDALTVVVADNIAPVAIIDSADISVIVGSEITFSGAGSSDADGNVANYLWDNGDVTATSTRSFANEGEFTVTLQVTDNEGLISAVTSITVTVEAEPAGVAVTFTCTNGLTTPGISVYVVGNIPELGNWTVSNAQKLTPTTYPTWQTTLDAIPANTTVNWKCVKANETTLAITQWEGGGDNVFTSGADGTIATAGGF